MSIESQGPTTWSYPTNGVSGPSYANDNSNVNHGRRSRLFQQQNSTLFNAFEEEGMALTQLPEEDDDDEEDRRDKYGNRTLVGSGSRRDRDIDGGKHPAYQEV
jgi:hypothetical protein